MTFVDEARRLFTERLPDLETKLEQYVPRILVKEGVSLQDARYARHLPQFLDPSEQVLEDGRIIDLPRVTVIGNAGSGKSFIVRKAYLQSIRSFLSTTDVPMPCFLDLGQQLIANQDTATALDFWYDDLFGRVSSDYEPGCTLFLDSLDEKLLREPNPIEFINAIALFLKDYNSYLRNVVIACRRSLWNTTWFQGLTPAFKVFHADHLDFEDYVHILPDRESRKEFFERAESLGIADLLGSPFVGFDLARLYQRGEPLPSSRRDWFEGQVEKLLRGQPRDRERDDVPPVSHLLFLAKQLACLATWSAYSSWTVAEAVDQLGEASILKEGQRITQGSIGILFQRPLFTKTGDRFSFSHQLFREYLAGEALSLVSLRKQSQLLTSSMPGIENRVLTPLRGVAVALAEASTTFSDFLIDADPIVAFLADIPISTAEYDERLLKIVIDNAVASNRAYWWSIPPRGDRLDRAFHKHRPRDKASFLRPYLENSEQMARLWATACATAWSGAPELNDTLLVLARDPEQHVIVRTNAIDAILASGHPEDIRQLYGLLSARDGRVRGHVLTAYRRIENSPPRDFIEKLCGGADDDVFSSFVRAEWWEYIAQRLDTCAELDEAFRAVNELYNRLGNFRPLLLESLFRRALQLGFDDLPVTLIVKTWGSHTTFRTHTYYHNLRKLLSTSRTLFARIWHCALDMLGQDDRWLSAWRSDELDKFAEACTDDIFDLLPLDAKALNFGQRRFVEGMLARYFHRDPGMSRLRQFKRLAPVYTERLRMPKSALVQTGRDQLEEAEKIAQALNQKDVTAAQRACLVISALGEILYGQEQASWLEPAEVIPFLRELRRVLLHRVVSAFHACITEITYSRVQGEETNTFRLTPWVYAVPFWILWDLGLYDLISAEKLDEFLRCYAFSGSHPSSNTSVYFPLIDWLQKESPQQWEECIMWLIEFPPVSLWGPLKYLARKESDIYIDQCRQRLLNCEFATSEFNSLLDYWQALRPPDFEQVLCQYYECLERDRDNEHAQSQQFRILWLLLSLDNDWAWEELDRCVEAGTVPTRASRPDVLGSQPLPRNPARLSAIVKWFTCVRQAHPQVEEHPEDLGQRLLQAIVDIGGEEAARELERLRREQLFSGAGWLSCSIIQIQDNLLMGSGDPWSPEQLLDFINQETMGIVRDERALFEWVCQTVEDEKESLEHGEQVGGYWTGNKPQTEPICQNILWPALERRLQHLGIVGVEEKYVGPNKVDFWVEKTTESNQQLQVFVELKVARKDYSRKELIDPLENQLWAEYLRPTGKRFGVYVVLWFKDESRYPYPTAWSTGQEFEGELLHRRAAIAKEHQLYLACYVVDMTLPIRRN